VLPQPVSKSLSLKAFNPRDVPAFKAALF